MMGNSVLTMLLVIFQASMMMVESKSYCTKGFVMDVLCINLGTLLDNPSLTTLPNPDRHSVHCLVEVQSCVDSGYRILVKPPGYQSGDDYLQDVQLDGTGNMLVVAEARRLGSCGTCDGSGDWTHGFAATIVGTLDEDAIPGSEQDVAVSDVVPPILYVTEVLPFDSPCPENTSSMPSTLSSPSSAPSPPDATNAPTSAAVTMNPSSMPSALSSVNSAPSPPDASNAPTPAAVTMNPSSMPSTLSPPNTAPSPLEASNEAITNPASSPAPTKSCGSVWQTMTLALALVPILSGMFGLVD